MIDADDTCIIDPVDQSDVVNEPPKSPKPQVRIEQRCATRYQCALPLAVVPITLDGSPGGVRWSDAKSVDINEHGLAFTLKQTDRMDANQLIIGVDAAAGRRFGVAEMAYQKFESETLRIGCRWIDQQPGDPFLARHLRPRINGQTMKFVYRYTKACLSHWHDLGVLDQHLIDRVLVCPSCRTLPTWRQGCHRCGSGRIRQDRLIHHFACAHVGPAPDFETPSGLQCPKCRTKSIIVGSDFEYIVGPLECFECDASGGQPAMSGLCHRCYQRFEPEQACEELLHAYSMPRLNVQKDLLQRQDH